MPKPKPLNLPQLAYAYKSGELTSEKMPERIRSKVKHFAEDHPLDQLEAMAKPSEYRPRKIGSPVHIRSARSG